MSAYAPHRANFKARQRMFGRKRLGSAWCCYSTSPEGFTITRTVNNAKYYAVERGLKT